MIRAEGSLPAQSEESTWDQRVSSPWRTLALLHSRFYFRLMFNVVILENDTKVLSSTQAKKYCWPLTWTWRPDLQLSRELAGLWAEDGLMMSESCASWHEESPTCRHRTSVGKLSWELSLGCYYSSLLISDGLGREEVQTSPGNQISLMMRAVPTHLTRRHYSHQSMWMTPLSCTVYNANSLKWQLLLVSWACRRLGRQDKVTSCRQLKGNNPNRVPRMTADTLQTTRIPLILL